MKDELCLLLTASGIDWRPMNQGVIGNCAFAFQVSTWGGKFEMWRIKDGEWKVEANKRYDLIEALAYFMEDNNE